MSNIEPLVEHASVLVTCGSGGVGKTTVAAALGLAGAELGRSACVVTIDPARRLADALGVGELANEPEEIETGFKGRLSALMLDPRRTFDDVVHRYASDEEQARRILSNRIYRDLVSSLSGTQEYMATEKLFELHERGDFDLLVVDTPPSRSALDFLDAPSRLAGFLDNRVFRLLVAPGHASFRAMNMASQLLLRTIARVAGSEIVDDAIAFFQSFEGMDAGFRERAQNVASLLTAETTAFVLVASPRRDSVEEATYFASRLDEAHRRTEALVVNRMQPDFGPSISKGTAPENSAWAELTTNLDELTTLADREEQLLGELMDKVSPAPVIRVPLLASDVSDLDSLALVAAELFGRELASRHGPSDHRLR